MINILTRREIIIMRDLNQLNTIRNRLQDNGIENIVRTNNCITNTGRSHGAPNINAEFAYEYRVYVHRKDYKKAIRLIF